MTSFLKRSKKDNDIQQQSQAIRMVTYHTPRNTFQEPGSQLCENFQMLIVSAICSQNLQTASASGGLHPVDPLSRFDSWTPNKNSWHRYWDHRYSMDWTAISHMQSEHSTIFPTSSWNLASRTGPSNLCRDTMTHPVTVCTLQLTDPDIMAPCMHKRHDTNIRYN